MINEKQIAIDFLKSEFSNDIINVLKNNSDNNKDEIIKYVIETKAWKDMSIRERYKGSSKILKNKTEICSFLKSEIANLSKKEYKDWFESVYVEVNQKYGLNIGLTQKLVNMTLKYFYFIEIGYDVHLFDKVSFGKLATEYDIPIDSYVLKWFLYNIVSDDPEKARGITSWTKMVDLAMYYDLQRKIKDLLKIRIVGVDSYLISETIVWNGIKKIRTEIKMEI